MGQAEVLKVLKKDKWLRTIEVANKLNQTKSIVNSSLFKVVKQGVAQRRLCENEYVGYEYKLK